MIDPSSLAVIQIGSKVRCTRSGEIGVVKLINEVHFPPEVIEHLRAMGANPAQLERLPALIFIEIDPNGRGIVRDRSSLELLRDN